MKKLSIFKKISATLLLMVLLVGCTGNAEPGEVEIPDGMLLPFEDGGLILDDSQITNAHINHNKGGAFYSNLSKSEDAEAFTKLMSEIEPELVGAVKDEILDTNKVFTGFKLGSEIYRISISATDQSFLAFVYKAKGCGYLYFRINENANTDIYYYSLYKISTDRLEKLEELLDGLEKEMVAMDEKPVIYLYPETEQDISVSLFYKGRLTTTYPAYNGGWKVRAYPDGRLINYADGLEYSYLYWEGVPDNADWWDLSEGYCVAGGDTASFLQRKLSELGLTPREYNEFIVYWLPQMQDNPYNLISFQWDAYEEQAPLVISPAPDSVLRIFMVFAPLENPIDIKAPAERDAFVRDGFTVVEWGGTKLSYGG